MKRMTRILALLLLLVLVLSLAPATALGCFAGISLGKDFKEFTKQGWKYILVSILVIAGTFFFSALVADIVLKLTHVI